MVIRKFQMTPKQGLLPNKLITYYYTQLVEQRLWYVLSCLWDGAYKRTLAANQKE